MSLQDVHEFLQNNLFCEEDQHKCLQRIASMPLSPVDRLFAEQRVERTVKFKLFAKKPKQQPTVLEYLQQPTVLEYLEKNLHSKADEEKCRKYLATRRLTPYESRDADLEIYRILNAPKQSMPLETSSKHAPKAQSEMNTPFTKAIAAYIDENFHSLEDRGKVDAFIIQAIDANYKDSDACDPGQEEEECWRMFNVCMKTR